MANQGPGGAIGVGLIILGSALALIGSIAVEFVRGWVSDRRKVRTVVGILLVEIESIILGLRMGRELASKHEESELPASVIQPVLEIACRALRRLDHYREGILLIKKERLRRDLPLFLSSIDAVCASPMIGGTLPIREIIEPYGELEKRGSRLLEQLRELKA